MITRPPIEVVLEHLALQTTYRAGWVHGREYFGSRVVFLDHEETVRETFQICHE